MKESLFAKIKNGFCPKPKKSAYKSGMFADVDETKMCFDNLKYVYENGLVAPKTRNTMAPMEEATVKDALESVCSLFAFINGKDFKGDCIQYAKNNGIVKDEKFDDLQRNIFRNELACLVSDTVGQAKQINSIDSIPDVAKGRAEHEKILSLYRAGIMVGNDDFGFFAPEDYVTRCELFSVIARAADESKRIKKEFKIVGNRPFSDAYHIIETLRPVSSTNRLANAWKYDNRFDFNNTSGWRSNTINDQTKDSFCSLIREFKPENEGVFHVELVLCDVSSSDRGVNISLKNTSGKKVINVTANNGLWIAETSKETAVSKVQVNEQDKKKLVLEFYIDLDNGSAKVIIDQSGVICVDIEKTDLASIVLGTEKGGTGTFSLMHARLTKNYVLNEHFLTKEGADGAKPCGWDITGSFVTKHNPCGYSAQDVYSLVAQNKAGETSSAYKKIDTVAGNIMLETYVLLPEAVSGAKVALMSGENDAFALETCGDALYYNDTEVFKYRPNTWVWIRFDLDTKTGKAKIKINGKEKATVQFTATSFDGYKVTFTPDKDACMWFDDVNMYTFIDYADYPDAPKVAADGTYNVGINVCNLWRDTTANEGWDVLSAFKEFDPYLGYYDEGLQEVVDWENKWMIEHGITFFHTCWYTPQTLVNCPIKTPRNMTNLNEAFMNSRYGKDLKFCIMWENGYLTVDNLQQFKDYVWPYWVEYYFKDERYLILDNKVVFTIYNMENLLKKNFGTLDDVKEALDFMNEDIKKLGYDGMLFVCNFSGKFASDRINELTYAGFASGYAYSWARTGFSPEYQIFKNNDYINYYDKLGLHHTPTVSVGFNDVARNRVRSPIITAEGFGRVCADIKNILKDFNTGTWQDNTVLVSTWNEYSEGTYILPCESNGFGYLEEIRKHFTNDKSDHTGVDVKPTKRQLDRLSHLYPTHHATIRHLQFVDPVEYAHQANRLVSKRVISHNDWEIRRMAEPLTVTNGVLNVVGNDFDPSIITKSDFEPFDASQGDIVHIRMRTQAASYMDLYYTTDTDGEWTGPKHLSKVPCQIGEFTDIYFDFGKTAGWNGKITGFRFDPVSDPFTSEIELFEILGKNEQIPDYNIVINGTKLNPTFAPEKADDGDIVLFAKEEDCAFARLRLFYEYDRDPGIVKFYSYDEQTLLLTVGSDKAVLNGNTVGLGYKFSLFDGLPVLHLEKLCSLLGYEYAQSGDTINITAATKEELERLSQNGAQ